MTRPSMHEIKHVGILAGELGILTRASCSGIHNLRARTGVELPGSPYKEVGFFRAQAIWEAPRPVILAGFVENGDHNLIQPYRRPQELDFKVCMIERGRSLGNLDPKLRL